MLPALLFDPKYRALLDDVRVVAHNMRDISDRLAGGRGTLGSLLKDEPGDSGLGQASQDFQATMANLKAISEKINNGEGTVGALIADPTVYERLVTILDGAQRSFLLRGMLRSLGKDGDGRQGLEERQGVRVARASERLSLPAVRLRQPQARHLPGLPARTGELTPLVEERAAPAPSGAPRARRRHPPDAGARTW